MADPNPLPRLLLRLDPDMPARLLAQHVDNGHGYCRVCSLPQAGPVRWPCTLHAAATAAHRAAETRRPRR